MPKRHLRFIGNSEPPTVHQIGNRIVEDVEDINDRSTKNYAPMKENFAANLRNLRTAAKKREEAKQKLVADGIVETDRINSLASYYLVLECFKRIPSNWLEGLKRRFPSISFKSFFDFNRQVIVSINGNHLNSFVGFIQEIATHEPAREFHPSYPDFKLIKSFRFYETSDRLSEKLEQVEQPQEVVIQFFNVSTNRQQSIESFLSRYFEITHLNKFFAEAKTRTNFSPKEVLQIAATAVDDIAFVSPAQIIVKVTPQQITVRQSTHTLVPASQWNNNIPIAGIIDTGISSNRDVLMQVNEASLNASIVDDKPLVDAQFPGGHGTGVAAIVAFGDQIINGETLLEPEAKVASIKVLSSQGGSFKRDTIPDLLKKHFDRGVKLFNMSINFPSEIKHDNSNTSEYAYWVDYQLAKKNYEDIVLSVSAGNIDNHDLIPSPLKFSTLFGQFRLNHHFHWGTNLTPPADSNNVLSVGAMKNSGYLCEFSRKDTVDYATVYKSKGGPSSTKVPTSWIQRFISKCHKKPDFLMIGESVSTLSSDFDSESIDQTGTSFAAPQACNMAAKIWTTYPSIKGTTVKALILNSCIQDGITVESDVNTGSVLPDKIANRIAEYGNAQKKKELPSLITRCIGYGKPDKTKALYSDESRVSLLVEDEISLNTEKSYKIHLPRSKNIFEGKGFFRVASTLVYNHIPIFTDHLNYNPILISFRITRDKPSYLPLIDRCTQLERDKRDGKGNPATLDAQIAALDKQIQQHMIHSSWSQDNYYNQQYSNVQVMEDRFLKGTLNNKTRNGTSALYLEVRCNIKSRSTDTNIFAELKDFIEKEQGVIINDFSDLVNYYKPRFSLVMSFEDQSRSGKVEFYNDLLAANVENLAVLDMEAEAIAEV